ncbi:MAG TPA: hypothetical protein VGO68_19545 [Pyrinomonadaceae bacterium]|jgi:hypothetical protein|nr:hypothetical protein [Pyrinomonadaceae bacterium]
MDFILLLDESTQAQTGSGPTIFDQAGSKRLEEVLSWFVADRGPAASVEIYAALPRHEAEANWLNSQYKLWIEKFSLRCFLLIAPDQFTAAMLQKLEADGLTSIIFTADSNNHANNESGLRVIKEYFLSHPSSKLSFGFWLPGRSDENNLRRISSFLSIGIPATIIDSPAFTFDAVAGAKQAAAPAELFPSFSLCRIFGNTLTVDVAGNLRYCPRDAQPRQLLGNIFTDTPEQLMIRKGKQARQAGKMEMCLSCRLRGRYAWPDRRSPQVLEAYRVGLNWHGGGPRPPFRLDEIPQRDLSAVSPAEQLAELENFEQRLLAWQNSLSEVQG